MITIEIFKKPYRTLAADNKMVLHFNLCSMVGITHYNILNKILYDVNPMIEYGIGTQHVIFHDILQFQHVLDELRRHKEE